MRFVLRRLGFYIISFLVAITLNFAIPRLMPGDPASTIIGRYAQNGAMTPQMVKSLREALGFQTNANVFQQYWSYLSGMAHGNLGISYSHYPIPVTTVILQDVPWTLFLFGIATILSFMIGTGIGIFSAWRRGGILDTILPPVMLFTSAFPYFWVALILVFVFAVQNPWFPTTHAYSGSVIHLTWPFVKDVVYHALLPAATIVIASIGGWILGMRNVMVSTLSEDYITMAQAKGLSDRVVMLRYAARNAILPNVTGFAMSLGFVLGGQVLTEQVFSYPGVGNELVNAALQNDYPLLQGILLFIVGAVLLANFIADVVYARLDPRVRQER